jgi:hypothetical protein
MSGPWEASLQDSRGNDHDATGEFSHYDIVALNSLY